MMSFPYLSQPPAQSVSIWAMFINQRIVGKTKKLLASDFH